MGAGGAKTVRLAQELPDALGAVAGIIDEAHSKGKQVVFFLDYDGTLTPIVSRPENALLAAETRTTLAALNEIFPTSIVTGRAVAKARQFVQVDGLMIAGSHGFDIQAPKLGVTKVVGEQLLPTLQSASDALRPIVDSIPGAKIEDNRFSVSVHYRLVGNPDDVKNLRDAVESEVDKRDLILYHGKMVWEIRLKVDWDKGKAMELLLEALDKSPRPVFPIYIGDDKTDEDAFKVLVLRDGIGVVVFDSSKCEEGAEPKVTEATLRLKGPAEVRQFLDMFVHAHNSEQARGRSCGSDGRRIEGNATAPS